MELTLSRSLQQTPNSPSKASSICIGFPTTPTKKNQKPKKKNKRTQKAKALSHQTQTSLSTKFPPNPISAQTQIR